MENETKDKDIKTKDIKNKDIKNMNTKEANNKQNVDFSILYDGNSLYDSFNKCKKGSIWKESVQRYEMNLLRNLSEVQKKLISGTYKQLPFNEFTLNERGRAREVKAPRIYDRIVLRSLCDNILNPIISKYLIYDNGASLKGKGVQFTRDRLVTHLQKFYRKNGSNDGYILLIDFRKFFDNIRHDKLLEEYDKRINNKDIMKLLRNIFNDFKIDVSYMSDEEYKYCLDTVFNALEYAKLEKSLLTGEKFMEKSIGIGSQPSQISGLLYPTRIDNYCKIVKGLKYYGRYMDDTYIIHKDKKYLQNLLKEIEDICNEYGLFINHKKTQIVKLSKKFSFLKVRYILTNTGKVVKQVNKDTIVRERRKLKKLRKLYENDRIPYENIYKSYLSWRGNLKHYNAYHTLRNMDKLYDELFIEPFINGRDFYDEKRRKRTNRTRN